MVITVIDGQGGGLGRNIIDRLKSALGTADVEIIALGTNAMATANMLKAGAVQGATGENAIVIGAAGTDIIVGAAAIVIANSMMGELTPAMACAIASSSAQKVLIPFNRCGVTFAGVDASATVASMLDELVKHVKALSKK